MKDEKYCDIIEHIDRSTLALRGQIEGVDRKVDKIQGDVEELKNDVKKGGWFKDKSPC